MALLLPPVRGNASYSTQFQIIPQTLCIWWPPSTLESPYPFRQSCQARFQSLVGQGSSCLGSPYKKHISYFITLCLSHFLKPNLMLPNFRRQKPSTPDGSLKASSLTWCKGAKAAPLFSHCSRGGRQEMPSMWRALSKRSLFNFNLLTVLGWEDLFSLPFRRY